MIYDTVPSKQREVVAGGVRRSAPKVLDAKPFALRFRITPYPKVGVITPIKCYKLWPKSSLRYLIGLLLRGHSPESRVRASTSDVGMGEY